MRLLEFSTTEGRHRLGLVVENGVADLTARHPGRAQSLRHLLRQPDWRRFVDATATADLPLEGVIHEPIAASSGRVFVFSSTSNGPAWFSKVPGSLVGHDQPLWLPLDHVSFRVGACVAAVLGWAADGWRGGRRISADRAHELVAGYTCIADGFVVEARSEGLSASGNFERSSSIGPSFVTADEFGGRAPAGGTIRIDGVEVTEQASSPASSLDELISSLSRIVELRPGDVIGAVPSIVTGDLQAGQTIEVELEGVGVLRNQVITEPR